MKSDEFVGNHLTIEAIVFSAWWTFANVELARIYSLSYIQTFFHPSLQCQTPPPRERKRKQPSVEENGNSEEDEVIDTDYRGAAEERTPYYFNQKDLVRCLCLTKSDAELLMSRLKQCNMLHENVAGQRKRHLCVCVFFFSKLFHASRWALLLLQSDRFFRGN